MPQMVGKVALAHAAPLNPCWGVALACMRRSWRGGSAICGRANAGLAEHDCPGQANT